MVGVVELGEVDVADPAAGRDIGQLLRYEGT
jgi:hypothetical protein